MFKPFAIALILCAAACSHPAVAMHMNETDKNHYVIISDGAGDDYLDCYSTVEGKWEPTCKEIRLLRYSDGEWGEHHRDSRTRY